MNDDELNRSCGSAFLLALRVFMQAHEISIPGTEDHKHWDLLREVAEGKATAVRSPAELALKYPHMKDYLARNANRLVEMDREMAKRVLAGFDARS